MNNLTRLTLELNNKNYFTTVNPDDTSVYQQILEENDLDPFEEYTKANDQINLLESAYSVLQILSNDIENFRKVETEFVTTSAAYQYLQKRLADIRTEIDRVKVSTHYTDDEGNTSSIISHLFYNTKFE